MNTHSPTQQKVDEAERKVSAVLEELELHQRRCEKDRPGGYCGH